MHKEILTMEQHQFLPMVQAFNKNFRLVGGTAIALQIGHRRSIDFDLFSRKPFKNYLLRKQIESFSKINQEIVDRPGELTFLCASVKFTFFQYPFDLEYKKSFENIIQMPDLLTLAAMKAHALGGRAKWKDYVDLYFILKDFFNLQEIVNKATELFQGEFNEKLFRVQLTYFKDISYAEPVEFLPGFEVADEIIKQKLIDSSLE